MKEILIRLFAHEELSHEEACNLMKGITRGDYNEAQIASLLTVFQMRGVKVNELTGFREALLTTRVPVDFSDFQPIDIVGTGGDGKNTFNISTCACFIVAGAGYAVAKHGNYGATSVSGASNVMEQHGVKFTNDESKLRRSIETCGIPACPSLQSGHENGCSGTESSASTNIVQSARSACKPMSAGLSAARSGRSSPNAVIHQYLAASEYRFCRSQQSRRI